MPWGSSTSETSYSVPRHSQIGIQVEMRIGQDPFQYFLAFPRSNCLKHLYILNALKNDEEVEQLNVSHGKINCRSHARFGAAELIIRQIMNSLPN
jgi:hypothetical protein